MLSVSIPLILMASLLIFEPVSIDLAVTHYFYEPGKDFPYTSLCGTRNLEIKQRRCWPSVHASTGFCLFSLFFVFQDTSIRTARALLVLTLLIGAILFWGRIVQGAHFLSHNILTMPVDWLICVILYKIILYKDNKKSS